MRFIRYLFVLAAVFSTLQASAVNPEKGYRTRPDSFGLSYKEIRLTTRDGATINTWVYDPIGKAKAETIIILCGDAGNMSYMIGQAATFASKGFTVITFDYRGFGESSDFATSRDTLYYDVFVEDFKTVLDYAKTSLPNNRLGLYAFSMGSIMAFLADPEDDVGYIITEGLVLDPSYLVQRIKNSKDIEVYFPESGKALSAKIQSFPKPMLVFAGEEDTHTTVMDAKVATKGKKDRKLVTFKGGHGAGAAVMQEKYFKEIFSFIAKL